MKISNNKKFLVMNNDKYVALMRKTSRTMKQNKNMTRKDLATRN